VPYWLGSNISRITTLFAKDTSTINKKFLTDLATYLILRFAQVELLFDVIGRIKVLFVNGWLKSTWNSKARRTWKLKTLHH